MILPTMTPEEKVRQMEKVKPFLHDAAVAWMNRNQKIVFKTKVFPTFYLFERNFDAMDETQTGLKVKLDEDDQLYYEETEEYNRQAGFKNLITYSRNGISLGLSGADRRYFNFTTFVSNEMLKDNQLGAQQHNLKEQLSIRYKTDLDPFAPQDNRFELVEASTRGYGLKKEVNLQTDENRES